MTYEEAQDKVKQVLKETLAVNGWESRYEQFKTLEPCIAETYKSFITGKMGPDEFYKQAVNDVMAAYSPLGKML